MDPHRLHERLEALHADLQRAAGVDSDSNRLLADIKADIERLLDASGAASGAPPVPGATLAERLERTAVRFSAAHPGLAATARNVVDLLGKMGV